MRASEIDEQNQYLLRQQTHFRRAANIVTDAVATMEEVQAVAVIGSVAWPLWKEIPRFPDFRRARIEVWHECSDLDLAVWIDSRERLSHLRRTRDMALKKAHEANTRFGVASHQVEIFLIEPGTDRYLGRLCTFNTCPKGHRDCLTPGCGDVPFNKVVPDFEQHDDLLAAASHAMLYERGRGRTRDALDLPAPDENASAPTRWTLEKALRR